MSGVRLIVLGRQGAGKGTQSRRLARLLGVPHVATGDLLRSAVRRGTELGLAASEHMHRGDLVPDELIIGLIDERLAEPDARLGFVLDGFPRTIAQGQALLAESEAGAATSARRRIDAAILLEVDEEVVIARMAARRVCEECGTETSAADPSDHRVVCPECGHPAVRRHDDTIPAIRRRLATYDAETQPLVAWFESIGLLVTVDGDGPEDEVAARVASAIAGSGIAGIASDIPDDLSAGTGADVVDLPALASEPVADELVPSGDAIPPEHAAGPSGGAGSLGCAAG